MMLNPDDEDRYDGHLGTAAETALATGNEQLAALLADCRIIDVTYLDTMMSLTSDEVWAGVRVSLEVPAYLAPRFSDELVGMLQGLLNASLSLEGETVLDISVVSPPAEPGWRERVVPTLSLDRPGEAEDWSQGC
jgi:hypothetical protein